MRFLDHVDREAVRGLLDRDEFFWLDLDAPGDEDVSFLGETFDFHPLALEDLSKRRQRPKLEDFGEYMFLVYYGADSELELHEVHAFLSGGYIVTVHEGRSPALEEARHRLRSNEPDSEQFVVYRVLDALTDSFFPLLEQIDEEIEGLEEAIFQRPESEQLERITQLRRRLVELSRVVTPQRDLLARGIDDIVEIPGLEKDSRDWFRDVYDHSIRISDQIDSFRDLLAGVRDAYLSTVSNRLNEITKQLTVVATIFLPLSFLVGFFGQNFGWLVRNINSEADFLIWGVGAALVSVLVLFAWFRRGSFL